MTQKDASTPVTAEAITPLSIHKKNRRDDEHLRHRYRFGMIALVCSVVGLVAGGLWLLNYLSKNPLPSPPATTQRPSGKPQLEEKTAALPDTPASPAIDPAQLALNKAKAEQKLAEFLEVKKILDGKAASVWGVDAYAAMTEIAHQADTHLMQKAYIPAAEQYDRATAMAGQLIDRAPDALQRLLAEGRNALAEGNGAVAQKKFSTALMIDPADPSAQKGLQRAKTIEEVEQFINAGRQHEAEHALTAAQNAYRQALRMDPDAKAAQQALNRVSALIREKQFNQLMSEGLTALHNDNYELAHTRLLKAKSLKPDSREVSDALFQVDQARRLARIDQLRHKARIADQSEEWQNALKLYLAVLDIDKNLQFAVHGKQRAQEQIRLAKRLNFFISQPQALESDKQLNNAILLLEEAKAAQVQGPKLAAQVKELEGLVTVFRTPVNVIIESDNITQVAVYKVGKLGRFSRHELKLRPGTYTVVGVRDGYQDVRQEIAVKPGQPSLRVTVKCRVKI
jgi:Flp pilus assembly protein TadD